MQDIPSKDLSELVDFPCEFSIKSIGLASPEFSQVVVETMQKIIPEISLADSRCTPSKAGKYHSVTVKFQASSADQVKKLYSELKSIDSIVMCL